jgi:DNA (cytosine-5)-methyltransferase 1
MKLKVLDLFSGIGGFSYGLEQTGGFETVAFCENNPFCRYVLAKHWPDVPCFDDVRTLSQARLRPTVVDVICGGFPCQDIAFAGNKVGMAGTQSGLWREYTRLIGELRPALVIVENTTNLLALGMGTVLGELAALGYDAEWECIPARAVGAPHERDRVWIVAYPNEARQPIITRRPGSRKAHGRQILSADVIRRWPSEWPSEPEVGRVVDGLSADVDAVAALGNAIVPQIATLIGHAILEAGHEREIVW